MKIYHVETQEAYDTLGENMTQEEMKRKLQKNAFDVYVAVATFARNTSNAEKELQEAKSYAKKLIEKIDEYLESLKSEFNVGDYVTVYVNGKEKIAKIDELTENNSKAHGLWYDRTLVNIKQDYWFKSGMNEFRHARPIEIAEYEVALTFNKHGRKPFEVKDGDLLENKFGKFIAYKSLFVKENFVVEGNAFLKTVEKVDEWLENK